MPKSRDVGSETEPIRFEHHTNAFGLLRFFMASAVMISHGPMLRNGDLSIQWVGGAAVAGFFAISGYLVAGSYLSSKSTALYLAKRVGRIYPAFIVASLVMIVGVAPLGGANLQALTPGDWLVAAVRIARLGVPNIETFRGTFFPMVDNPMWTIAFEFRCYLLLIPLGLLRLLTRPWALAALSALLLLAHSFAPAQLTALDSIPVSLAVLGTADTACKLFGIFLAGATLYALRHRVRFTLGKVALAGALLLAAWSVPILRDLALGVFGSYLVVGISFLGRGTWMERVNNRNDISYGVYLYAWPITKLLLWYWPGISLGLVMIVTFFGALACGWASWLLVEKPALEWLRLRMKRRVPAAPVRAPAEI